MKNKFRSLASAALVSLFAGSTLTACDEDTLSTILTVLDYIVTDDDTTISVDDKGLGWLSNDEDTESIEDDIQINPGSDSEISSVTGLPSKVDLSAYMPKVGDQGSFGTCCAWASAYHGRTWLYAHTNGLKTSQLTDKNSFSAADIFQSIDSNDKGADCQGTNFQYALAKMVTRGVATRSATSEISSYSDCACSPSSKATTDAAKYKIKSYREINIKDVTTVKRYLAEGRIVLFGAKLGDNFMNANSNAVLYSNGTFNSTGIHAYHAIVCCGYDESKGTNGAFRVINSWGTSWGDSGYIWIDCNFFCGGEFAYCGFVMYDLSEDDSETIESTSGVDLQAYKVTDTDYYEAGDADSDDPSWRTLVYDVYNAGSDPVPASNNWAICYLLYNAYNANEYQIVLFDLYSNMLGGVPAGTSNNDWSADEAYNLLGVKAQGFSISNYDVAAQQSVAAAVTGDDSQLFSWSYKLPTVTGSYYLVLMADAFGAVTESDKTNNYYFLTTSDGKPLELKNGVIQNEIGNNKSLVLQSVKPRKNAHFDSQSPVTAQAPNTYSPQEIAAMIRAKRESGELVNKALQWSQSADVSAKPKKSVKF